MAVRLCFFSVIGAALSSDHTRHRRRHLPFSADCPKRTAKDHDTCKARLPSKSLPGEVGIAELCKLKKSSKSMIDRI